MVARDRDITKRMKYFDRQFLRARDFVDEQDYHLDRRCRHNRLLHTHGIPEIEDEPQLIVTRSEEAGEEKMVLVSPGTAYDLQGREIVLTTARKIDLSEVGKDPGPPISYRSPLYLTIAYGEELVDPSTDPGIEGYTRIKENPKLEVIVEPPTDQNQLLLAVIERDTSTGDVTDVDLSGRPRAGGLPPGSIGPQELQNGAVESRHIALAESGDEQDPTTGTGVKTSHLKDRAVSIQKLKTVLRVNDRLISLPAGASAKPITVLETDLDSSDSAFFLVYAYSTTPDAKFFWNQGSLTEEIDGNLKIRHAVFFTNLSPVGSGASIPIEITVRIYQVLES